MGTNESLRQHKKPGESFLPTAAVHDGLTEGSLPPR